MRCRGWLKAGWVSDTGALERNVRNENVMAKLPLGVLTSALLVTKLSAELLAIPSLS